jgi:hypothetical protein
MDISKLKAEAELKAEYSKFSIESNAKKEQIRKDELAKLREGFKAFFTTSGFQLTETPDKIIATYQGSSVILTNDAHSNSNDQTLTVHATIQLIDKKEFHISTLPGSDHKKETPIIAKSEEERMKRDLLYHKDFVEGRIKYSFKYSVRETRKVYDNMIDLLNDL